MPIVDLVSSNLGKNTLNIVKAFNKIVIKLEIRAAETGNTYQVT